MSRQPKIYTRKGDDGTTALGTRERVYKDTLRVEAYGTVDELNSILGLALAHGLTPKLTAALTPIQNELFNLGAVLSFPNVEQEQFEIPKITSDHVKNLEALIDELNLSVEPLRNFVLPGGSVGAAHLHVARTICRRAERLVVSLSQQEQVGENAIPYLNRLSDALFVMARYENHLRGMDEPIWDSTD